MNICSKYSCVYPLDMVYYSWVIALNRIKKLRKERNLTQAQLAQRLGISASAVGMYEQGRREPDSKMLRQLAQFFGVSMEYLMGEDTSLSGESVEFVEFIDRMKQELIRQKGLMFNGVPLSEQDIEEIMSAVEVGAAVVIGRNRR